MNAVTPLRAGRREWIGLAMLILPTLLISMDLTVLNLAVPHLSAALKPSSAQLLWIVDIYGFLVAGSLITMGTLGDRIGRRRLLLMGAAAFGFASVLAAFSTSATMLIATRALLGIAGATLMPSTLSLIRNMFLDPRQRTVAIGVWISGFSVGSAIGPLLGGLFLEQFWWGSVFLLSVPVMALLLVAGPVLLPEYRDPQAGRLDLTSAALSLAAVLAMIYGIKQIAEDGLSGLPVLFIVVGLSLGVLFVRRQQRLADPLVDLKLFRVRAFSAALATNTLGIFVVFGSFLLVAQYLQLVLDLSPLQAGLWAAPGTIAFIIGSNLAPRIVRRVHPSTVVTAGLTLAAIGMGMLTQVGLSSLALVVIGNVLMSIGFGLTFTLTTDLIVGTAPPERAGAASAISETGNELGGALGIAILGSIGTAVYHSLVATTMPASIPPEAAQAARETLGGAVAAAAKLPDSLAAALLHTARQAFVQELQLIAVLGTVGLVGTIILAAVLLRQVRPHAASEDEAEAEQPAKRRTVSKATRPIPESSMGD
jgi:DHA2 family multidrug resistance protein-like MFS transporter